MTDRLTDYEVCIVDNSWLDHFYRVASSYIICKNAEILSSEQEFVVNVKKKKKQHCE